MARDIACFWVEPTGEANFYLRRWISTAEGAAPCPGPARYHNASVYLERRPERRDERGYLAFIDPGEYRNRDWPTRCEGCGLDFGPVADWSGVSRLDGSVNQQVQQEPLYAAPDGRAWELQNLPAGAMFDAIWQHDGPWVGSDGISLTVVCPYTGHDARGAFWMVDGPASNGEHKHGDWTRTGDPRTAGQVTAHPSIKTSEYHGWLRNGHLVQC